MRIVPYYAAVLALLFLYLSYRVIEARRTHKVSLGAGGIPALERVVRVHANFAEYAPFALVLMGMAELRGVPGWALHALGAALVLGRASHAYGVSRTSEMFRFRIGGMMLTFFVLAAAAVALLLT